MDKYRIYNDRGISQMGNVRVTVETSTSSMMEQRRDASSNAFRDLTNASVLSTPLTHKAVALAHHPRPGPSQSTATPITPQSARKRAGPKQANGRYKYGYRALQEIRHLQKTTNNLIPKMSFARLVKAIAMRVSHVQDLRWNVAAMAACQEGAEAFLTRLFEDASICTQHAKRKTLLPTDLQLVRRLQNF